MEFLTHAEELLESWRKFKRVFRQDVFMKELSFNEVVIMQLIQLEEELLEKKALIQVKDLSEKAKISRPALNAILNKLEARELIERVRLGDNRKSVYVKLGKNAHSIYDDEKEKMIQVMNRIVEQFGLEETNQMIYLLNKLREIVEEEVKSSC